MAFRDMGSCAAAASAVFNMGLASSGRRRAARSPSTAGLDEARRAGLGAAPPAHCGGERRRRLRSGLHRRTAWASRRSSATFPRPASCRAALGQHVSSPGSGQLAEFLRRWRSDSASRWARLTSARGAASLLGLAAHRPRPRTHRARLRAPDRHSSRPCGGGSTSALVVVLGGGDLDQGAAEAAQTRADTGPGRSTKARVPGRRRAGPGAESCPRRPGCRCRQDDRAGWFIGEVETAVTWPCSANWSHTRPVAACTEGEANESRGSICRRRSAGGTDRPAAKSMSRRSIRTMSWIESRVTLGSPVPCVGPVWPRASHAKSGCPVLASRRETFNTAGGTAAPKARSSGPQPRRGADCGDQRVVIAPP